MARYRLKEGFTHFEDGPPTPTPAGTIVSMSAKRAHSLRDRFELVDEQQTEAEDPFPQSPPPTTEPQSIPEEPDTPQDPTKEEEDHSDWIKEFASLTAKEAVSTASVLEELDVLDALLAVESRSTVVAALEERIEEIA